MSFASGGRSGGVLHNLKSTKDLEAAPADESLLRVWVELEPYRLPSGGLWPPYATETFWAERVSATRARIDNIPFFASQFSNGDVVETTITNDQERMAKFLHVVKRSGHSTFRIVFTPGEIERQHPLFTSIMDALTQLQCRIEVVDDQLWAIDSPLGINPNAVSELLEIGAESDLWGSEQGYFAEAEWDDWCRRRVAREKFTNDS